uniref:Serpentine Receptor, class BC (Class B-like) n=1 Tax=Caenorhabditis tropicalis TaxID=1561998 RepID=A0A1I7SZ22_9PELO
MVVLGVSYWIFTVIGIIVTVLTVALCIFILHRYAFELKVWRKIEYQFILFRVFCDIFNGIGGVGYFVSSSFTLLYSEIVPFDVTFVMGLFGSNFLEMRSFLAAFIAIERVLATFAPLKFYYYRRNLSNIPIILFILSTGLAVEVVLFGFCDFRLPLVPGCVNYACATPPCFVKYAAVTKVIYGSLNATFSAILCLKLFMLSWKQATVQTDIRKANMISLTDGLSTMVFELLPTLIFDSKVIDVTGYGPVVGVLRQSGRAVEALVMVKLMEKKKKTVQPARMSVSVRNNVF